jgi:hypothetical protein
MSSGTTISPRVRIASIALGTVCLLLWVIVVVPMAELGRSDPAGNAMAQGFAGLGIILLWGLLSILAVIASMKGAIPAWARIGLILVPVSGAAAMMALDLLSRPGTPPYRWPMLVPALLPPCIVAYCLFALLARPGPRANAVSGLALGMIAVVSAAVLPLQAMRSATVAQAQNARAKLRAGLTNLPHDAPLAAHLPFLQAADQTIVDDARSRIRTLERRQAEAEALLERGDFPLRYLGSFDLDATSSLCDKARALLRKRVEALISAAPGTKPYAAVANEVSDALSAMHWLIGYGCDCTAESLTWENMAKAYRDPSYDVISLARLREPGWLGRKLREDPDSFSQLGPQSHLKAWLKFSDDPRQREQVVAGARALERRTTEAIEILTDIYQESSRFRLLRVLPAIDLTATPALCAAAARVIRTEIAGVYRPRPDDPPMRYSELLGRLGVGAPLTTLVWLGEHGCDVEPELHAAEAAVRAYADSPARAAMLATLARLRRGP